MRFVSAAWRWRALTSTPRALLRTNQARVARPLRPTRWISGLPVAPTDPAEPQQLGRQEPRLRLVCTCDVCKTRSTYEFSRASYETGVVLVQCPSCENRHLIADHKGWFKDLPETQGGSLKTLEDMVRAQGGVIARAVASDKPEGDS